MLRLLLLFLLLSALLIDAGEITPIAFDRFGDSHYFVLQLKESCANASVLAADGVIPVGHLFGNFHVYRLPHSHDGDEETSRPTWYHQKALRETPFAKQCVENVHYEPLPTRRLQKRIFHTVHAAPIPVNSTKYYTWAKEHLGIGDPLFTAQWHLHSTKQLSRDLNVTDVWRHGITGKGITVCVMDDGLQIDHPDVKSGYNQKGSYDFNTLQPVPLPETRNDYHGTRCAGEVMARRNNACGVGIAYDAEISGNSRFIFLSAKRLAHFLSLQQPSESSDQMKRACMI